MAKRGMKRHGRAKMAPGRQRLNAAQTQEASAANDQNAVLQGTAVGTAISAEPKQDQSQTNGQGVDPNKDQGQVDGQGADPNKDQGKTDGQDTGQTKAKKGGQKSGKKKKKSKPSVEATDLEWKQLANAIVLMKLWILAVLVPGYNFTVVTPFGPISHVDLLKYSIASALACLRQEVLDDIKSRTKPILKGLRFIDDEFFRVAVDGQMELIQALLRDITGDYTLTLKSMQVQMDFSFPKKYHSLVADVFCVTTNNELIILEIQKEDRVATYPRSLFEGFAVGFDSLSSGESYKNLKPVYVVYLTNTDVFNSGELLHIGEEAHFVPGVESDVKPLFKTFYLNCAYVENGEKAKNELKDLRVRLAQETKAFKKGQLNWRIETVEKILAKRAEAKKNTMASYGIDDARWDRLETWGCDFMAKDIAAITRKDMAEIMRLLKETGDEGVSLMSAIMYQAFKADIEEAREEGLEEGIEKGIEKGSRATTVKMARGLLASGVDPNIVAENAGYTLDELADLLVSTVS